MIWKDVCFIVLYEYTMAAGNTTSILQHGTNGGLLIRSVGKMNRASFFKKPGEALGYSWINAFDYSGTAKIS